MGFKDKLNNNYKYIISISAKKYIKYIYIDYFNK